MDARPIRILIADDHAMVRSSLRRLLDREPGFEVIAEAEDGESAARLCADHKPDVVIMDVIMPGAITGIEATKRIVDSYPRIRVIGLSGYADRSNIAKMLRAGAAGYLLKVCEYDELRRAVTVVHAGQTYLTPEAATVVVAEYQASARHDEPRANRALSSKEREVLGQIATGRTSREIGEQLGTSVKTVESHRRNIMKKLDIHSVAGLTKFAIREGLTSLE